MRRIRSRDTLPELAVRSIIHRLGYRFRLHRADLPGKPDIVLPRLKKTVLVHGCFWHQHMNCADGRIPQSRVEYWKPKLEKNCERDRNNRRQLQRLGWKVLVLWECEIKHTAKTVSKLQKYLSAP